MVWIQNLTTKFLEADFKYFWYSKSHCYRETALNIHRLVVKDFLNLEVKDFLNLVVKDFLNFNFFRVFFPHNQLAASFDLSSESDAETTLLPEFSLSGYCILQKKGLCAAHAG